MKTGVMPLMQVFVSISDPRSPRHTQHDLAELLTVVVCGVLSGADDFVGIEEWAKLKLDWLRGFMKLEQGIPSHDTLARVFGLISPDEFEAAFRRWVGMVIPALAKDTVVAIDGKTSRRSHNKNDADSHPLHLVSAFAAGLGVVLGQKATEEKSNEITAIPELLEMLNLKGAVVTIDAMGTQRAIAHAIVDKGGDYILSVKGNQGRLHDETRDQFAFALRQLDPAKLDSTRWSLAQTKDTGHDRDETRQIMVCHDLGWMDPEVRGEWKNLSCVIMVHRRTLLGAGKTRSETSYHMSSLKDVKAPDMLTYTRNHWGIENRCHWVLDAIYREDHNQTRDRNSAANQSILRRMALNAHNRMPHEGKKRKSLPKRELRATHDTEYLEQLLSLV